MGRGTRFLYESSRRGSRCCASRIDDTSEPYNKGTKPRRPQTDILEIGKLGTMFFICERSNLIASENPKKCHYKPLGNLLVPIMRPPLLSPQVAWPDQTTIPLSSPYDARQFGRWTSSFEMCASACFPAQHTKTRVRCRARGRPDLLEPGSACLATEPATAGTCIYT
ncbi:hypothetical protein LMH87_005169 [Akanthomyces muscarius]|uniref:Uncharacterized protein n=1 Tax=Akanthomyces muscarius TaxID=2231603 RepID=A0A9W8QLA7_AKAMU|nr:hypothetical protein LMH87_005169 [Akanthomyces muscarius]KAJ4163440.1 hypothetical protein LMH87_005169 [Akanthomyces muscarius]